MSRHISTLLDTQEFPGTSNLDNSSASPKVSAAMLVHLPISQMSAGYEIGRNKGKGDGITSADALKSRKFKQVNSTKGGVAVKRSITCRWNFGSDAMLCTTSLTTNASFLSLILSHRMLEQRVAHHGNTQIGGAT